jgi:HEAT repeat protein
MRRLLPLAPLAACLLAAAPAAGGDDRPEDDAAVRAAGLPADGSGLVAFFRARARGEADPGRIRSLVAALGDPDPAAAGRAAVELVAVGPPAAPALREAARDPDLSPAAARARRCLWAVGEDSSQVTAAAARLLAARRPEGALEALLEFLPAAEDETVIEEVKAALAAAAAPGGEPDPALLRALADGSALRRSAAADVLCQAGLRRPPAEVARLLGDPVPAVRLHAALDLARADDGRAVPVLIALLAELPAEQVRDAEDFLAALAADRAPKGPPEPSPEGRRRWRDAWAAWWQATEGAGLLDEFRKRTRGEADRDQVARLIRELGDDSYDVRQKATERLKGLGARAAPMLRPAANHPDVEVRQRAQALLEEIDKEGAAALPASAPRLVALRKPAGAAEVLLAYLPCAEDEDAAAEVQAALRSVALPGGRPDPAMARALADPSPARRAAAADALGDADDAEVRAAVRKLLADRDPGVRLRAALALAYARDRAAVPVLIDLLAELPADKAAPAEEYLGRLAGDRPAAAPGPMPRADAPDPRRALRDAWAAWWAAEGGRVALAGRPAPADVARHLGYTLMVQTQNNQVAELDPAGKVRWQLTGLAGPQDAEVLPGDRVLVAETAGGRVTERNLRGDVLWQKAVVWPVGVQRLPGGRTFIAARGQLVEVDRSGREVFSQPQPTHDVLSARKLRDGRIVCVSNQGHCRVLDASGRELKRFNVPGASSFANEVLPKGGVLVPSTWQNKVTEYDADGKVVWEASVVQPMSASRLPNGHTLVSVQQWPGKLIELDRAGKAVAETPTAVYTARARRR